MLFLSTALEDGFFLQDDQFGHLGHPPNGGWELSLLRLANLHPTTRSPPTHKFHAGGAQQEIPCTTSFTIVRTRLTPKTAHTPSLICWRFDMSWVFCFVPTHKYELKNGSLRVPPTLSWAGVSVGLGLLETGLEGRVRCMIYICCGTITFKCKARVPHNIHYIFCD